ncbi:MAG: DUF4465 domain-containing protein [Opitutales bacterium]|nr:DUF4465 domain-containing protein [Opitutales bacterium]
MHINKFISAAAVFAAITAAQAAVITFEDVDLGSNKYMPTPQGSSGSSDWSSGNMAYFSFNYTYYSTETYSYTSWDGFKVSKDTDTATHGYTNEHSAITGSGAGGSSQYGIFYGTSTGMTVDGGVATTDMGLMSFGETVNISSIAITNTTYAYYEMSEGSAYVPKMLDSDYYMNLLIFGIDEGGDFSGVVSYALGNSKKIANTWNTVDLSPLGAVVGLGFAFETNEYQDMSQWGYGISTDYPIYVAFDNITYNVPEPSTCAALFGGLALAYVLYRRRRA